MLNLYYANIDVFEDKAIYEYALNRVDKKRREKVQRCKNKIDKKRSLLAGLLLRQGLEELGYSFETLEFSVTETGKPYVKSDVSIQFSISHAGDYVCCILSDEPVGVDIESSKKTIFLPQKKEVLVSMAKKCLSDREWECFWYGQERERIFLEYWTKKEAYSKCKGKGLGMDFSEIDTESGSLKFWSSGAIEEYHVSVYRLSERYEELTIYKVRNEDL